MNTGLLQRQWSEEKPQLFEKETMTVKFDVLRESHIIEGVETEGYSFVQVQLDKHVDYAHIKSTLIEKGFAQKDEFGFLNNAVNDIISAAATATDFSDFQKKLDTEDILAFSDFCQFRTLCADTAKAVIDEYYKL